MNPARTECVVRKRHGESCNATQDTCDPSILELGCRDGVCQCAEPDGWDADASICYGNHTCGQYSYYFYDREVATTSCVATIRLDFDTSARVRLTCPLNSTLVPRKNRPKYGYSSESICECNYGLIEEEGMRKCIPVRHRGEKCSSDNTDRCDFMDQLSCLNDTSTCGCDGGLVWDRVKENCQIPAGSELMCQIFSASIESNKIESDCVSGSFCDRPLGGSYHSNGVCLCEIGYETVNGLCLKKHGLPCQGEGECKSPYSCMDGVCECPDPLQQRYDAKIEACRVLAGSNCSTTSGTLVCAENAECQAGVCKCLNGSENGADGTCIYNKTDGKTCSAAECNSYQGLTCSEGVCTCISPELKFVPGKGCTATLGLPCGVLKPFGNCNDTMNRCDYFVGCQESAECRPSCEGGACLSRDQDLSFRCKALRINS